MARILDINLTGVFLGIRAVVKPMKAAGLFHRRGCRTA
jgi:NAD(P)-dependent dehydrogenase (short-subunit alcohol dehydrogenase family)